MKRSLVIAFLMTVLVCSNLPGQVQNASGTQGAIVPTLVKYSGAMSDASGKPLIGTLGVTFLLYKDEQGGAPLWLETQNVAFDKAGHFSVTLGATRSEGLPTELFASGDARWLAVQPEGQVEHARVLLLSVPYALKASDAETLGGMPASAFARAKDATGQTAATTGTVTSVGLSAPLTDFTVSGSPVTSAGTLGFAWRAAPTNLDLANTIVKRDSTGSFNTAGINATRVTASVANVTSHLIVTGTGDGVDAITGNAAATAVSGHASASTGPAWGLLGQSDSSNWNAYGVYGDASATSGTPVGVYGAAHAGGAGVQGTNSGTGYAVYGLLTGSAGQGVWGESKGNGFVNGAGSDGVHGVAHNTSGSGVAGVNDGTDATGVYGSDPVGYGFVTDSHVQQARGMGGWVKAMAYIDGSGNVLRCFNSQLNGSAASTAPCGLTTYYFSSVSEVVVDFGFQVDDRFVSVDFRSQNSQWWTLDTDHGANLANSQVRLYNNNGNFMIFVY